MSVSDSILSSLLSTHDLKLACSCCSVQNKQVTYTIRSVQHQCAHTLLLCRVKGGSLWRPISRRPTLPIPNRYEVCWHFKEGLGCTVHKNRCTFASSIEEAAVWNFEKQHRLDHQHLCRLLTLSERGPEQPNSAAPVPALSAVLNLKAACNLCSVKVNEKTYEVLTVVHKCERNLLLAKDKVSRQWKHISERPTGGKIGSNVLYKVCDYFVEGSGCTQHILGQGCTYAKSSEEAVIWNYLREHRIDQSELIRLLAESESVPITPERAAEKILQQFSGEFVQLCKHCFNERPQKLTTKRWNETCSADAAHTWDPVLVHHLSENTKHIYNQIRSLPNNCQFKFCSHVRQGKPCWHQAGHCHAAQSEVEMAVWKAEHSGLSVQPYVVQLSPSQKTQSRHVSMFCKVCLLVLSSPESFYKHCSSSEHAQLLAQDTTTRWRKRQPPHSRRADFWLCDRPQSCEYGLYCPKAHSEEELQEWMMRAADEEEIRCSIQDQGLMCYNQRLLDEYRNSSGDGDTMCEQVDDVTVSCDEDLIVECEEVGAALKWNFQVETERQLVHVGLLKQEPGAWFSLDDSSSVQCVYLSDQQIVSGNGTYSITVSFTSVHPGLYEQWLVMDFDMRPVLLKKLKVRVGELSSDEPEQPSSFQGATFQSVERWNRGNRVVIPCSSRTEEQEELLKKYKPQQMNYMHKSSHNKPTPLTKDNYREKMHQFLYDEEQAEDQVVSRLNVCGVMTTTDKLNSAWPPPGELFCSVPIPCNLTVESPEGLVLKRSIRSALIAPLNSHHPNSKVYEASVLTYRTIRSHLYLQLSKQCCSDLKLRGSESHQVEVQFQLDRHSFCTMHKAVDLLPDTSRVLPDLRKCGVPVSDVAYKELNPKQQSAVAFTVGNCDGKQSVAPLLIYGPFGTGKTFTLATAAIELCKLPHNKVLICTYTNSSADLYVRDHFHPFIRKNQNGLRPIRIKANKHGSAFSATDKITLKYCFLSEDRQHFRPPTKAALDDHNIVITTTTMARHFHELKLAVGYFTHILIDEASQMLECEALMALGLAGPNTRVVLAGDHMQMGPQLFSVEDHRRSDHTVLTRLFHYYQGQKCDAAQSSRIIFSDNYRSTKEIVEFVSTHFYVGKNDVITAAGDIPAPANGHALKFRHVRGKCLLDTMSMSWYNRQEVAEVLKAVKDILTHWPPTWGPKAQTSICILSEGFQVPQIRSSLSSQCLSEVNVETLANVQGKQFRAVILTAVQTRDSLETSHLPGLPLFNDARVLNTAMTRAQSQVVVVGDAAALCCFGKCSRIWKSFIDHCISNKSIAPLHYSKDFFEKDVMETSRFQKVEHVDESNSLSDAILQELKDEYEQLKTEYSSDEDISGCEDSNQKSRESYKVTDVQKDLLELCEKYPQTYKRGKLVRELYNRGYVVPFHDQTRQISIQGRANLGKAFTGDEVVVQIPSGKQAARVVSVIKTDESARELVCFLEGADHSKTGNNVSSIFIKRMMVPFKRSAPKVCILISKKKRNFIPIWEETEGYRTIKEFLPLKEIRDSVFVVQVIGWKDTCFYPLGNVTDILPKTGPGNDRFWLLKEEFGVAATPAETTEGLSMADQDASYRQNETKTFTFTVDPAEAADLDDAISVRDTGDHYELGIHISDVASFVRAGSPLDTNAEEQGCTKYGKGQSPIHMFPESLSTGCLSLLKDQDRRVISLMFKVQKETHEIDGKPIFQLSMIKSDRQLSYEEAEDIISQRYKEKCKFDTLEDCVSVAYCFTKARRRSRLSDWAYSQCDDRLPGKRKAHLMIEEMNVLFNAHAADTLLDSDRTRSYIPLRCQKEPDSDKIENFKKECGKLIPLSFHVRPKVNVDEQVEGHESFRILTEVWEDILSAVRADDVDKMVDLVAADDIHPLLQPVINQFKRCCSKAYVMRSNSSPEAQVGHYSLSLPAYTQASSPIRRYMDIILQRLLHSVICDKPVQHTRTEITGLCSQFDLNIKKAKDYEQKTEQVFYAVSMKTQSAPKLAFVVCADQEAGSLAISFPFNRNIFPVTMLVMYNDLQLEDQPISDEASRSITLKWKRRIYAADSMPVQELNLMPAHGPYVKVPMTVWRSVSQAIEEKNFEDAKSLLMNANARNQIILPPRSAPPLPQTNTCSSEVQQASSKQSEHWVDILLQLQPGDTLKVQMTSEEKRSSSIPCVQLVHIRPKFEICVDHVHSPITCFSKVAHDLSRTDYADIEQYVHIWKPMCKMESASTAVDESDSIIIENLVVNLRQEQTGMLTGNFFLHEKWIKEWVIECNLAQCFLCIRKRGLKLTSVQEHSAQVDPKEYTWVAHGITRTVDEKKNVGSKVEFYANHLPMENIPDCVFEKDTRFTVEIIPKLLPDIRKENAVNNLRKACNLVQSIILGHRIPKEERSFVKHQIRNKKLSSRLPELNDSQNIAVATALNNTFTLIQGPPGTGKTVVGVYMVWWFFEMNSTKPRKFDDPKDKDKDKKEVILYCGPSNKSVDVVAEYLMRLKESLRILRVYSQQVEMLDYPYPNCTLQFSPRTFRQDRSKPELRSITLHHRMREEPNPSAGKIKKFDERIRVGEELTDGDVEEYKRLLKDARAYELKQHDIILCTCTQSSTPSLIRNVSARQILIDECAMATEPQALIPLVCNKPEQIVLIGDHKQLRPIVKNDHVKKLGMNKSLFERYYDKLHGNRAVMLDTQYRMHVDICKFPSEEFYDGKLRTGVEQPSSVLRVEDRTMPVVFGHIKGETVRLVVKTHKGNNNSKANQRERDAVAKIAEMLVREAKVKEKSIVVLSPYNAQVSEISDELKKRKLGGITVTTITKSQGSEWSYVILSTVCSLPSKEIMPEPDRSWLSKHVGFVGDPNQINVAITRAKEGLCIIGNQKLLRCSRTWNKLLQNYSGVDAVTKAEKISVHGHR
ncbi:helicase with zinc finger domain 2-like isoform X2 [Melanotaenia boesemani]|uniref:helicase with zinc finger domain 2-like isoform X2 n=1 Tax=Melanotaenia boesemani TaxID=1250792 RepID=UPI001C053EC5|nr:helicase with zinc finger domain 2-like isoform X2 [Melanotaenia boesemani]